MEKHVVQSVEFFTFSSFSKHRSLSSVVTTRRGGCSEGDFRWLNIGLKTEDPEPNVRENRHRVAAALGVGEDSMLFARQVHSANVAVVRTRDASGEALEDTDGMVTDVPDTPLVVQTADCAAITLFDPVRNAVGVLHAGWRGTLAGICGRGVAVMAEAFGTRARDVVAAVGPSIGPCCYEVGDLVIDAFETAHPRVAGQVLTKRAGGKTHLDLWAANRLQLIDAGLGEDRIDIAGLCTVCHADTFFSHRAGRGRTGRFGNIVMINERVPRAY